MPRKPRAPTGPEYILPPPPLAPAVEAQMRARGVGVYAGAVIAATNRTHAPQEQAQLLRLSIETITTYRSALRSAGALRSEERKTFRPPSPEEVRIVKTLLIAGDTTEAIATQMGVPPRRVQHIISRWNLTQYAPHYYSQEDVANLFGLTRNDPLRHWRECGWLNMIQPTAAAHALRSELDPSKSHRTKPRNRNIRYHYRITRSDLLAFLRQRDAWMSYDPNKITDPELRAYALTLRAAAGGRWVRLVDVVTAHYYGRERLTAWVQSGWPGPEWRVRTWKRAYWIWIPTGSPYPDPPAPGWSARALHYTKETRHASPDLRRA